MGNDYLGPLREQIIFFTLIMGMNMEHKLQDHDCKD